MDVDSIATRMKLNKRHDGSELIIGPAKDHTKSRLTIQTFRLLMSHLHTNTNLHPKGSKFTLEIGLVDEMFTFIYIYNNIHHFKNEYHIYANNPHGSI